MKIPAEKFQPLDPEDIELLGELEKVRQRTRQKAENWVDLDKDVKR